ncbi:NADH dehydrogenase (ubiquinone) B14.5 B subunit [Carabus blaptoides fortunei]
MASALELLTPDDDRIPSLVEKAWAPGICAALGFGAACFINWGTRRPVFSGIQKHVVMSGVGAIIGQYVDGHRNAYLAERDAVLRRYVELHPDDFPTPERKKYATTFEPWIPVR